MRSPAAAASNRPSTASASVSAGLGGGLARDASSSPHFVQQSVASGMALEPAHLDARLNRQYPARFT
jgi:hypothetical protein